jgi:alpha-beta hydrolase superfamily lysophospholipase
MTLPHELTFVLDVPATATVTRHDGFDLYRPQGDGPLPAVVIVPGPAPAAYPIRPRDWPVYVGYAQLMSGRGLTVAILDMPYHNVTQWQEVSPAVPGLVESVRGLDAVDADRVAVWAFSGGALLVGSWFAESPPWLRCLALTYPMLGATQLQPGRPLVLTRVGQEAPELQAEVDRFLVHAATTGTSADLIDVPNGHHGFDGIDHTEESRDAVLAAADLVAGYVSG